MECKDYVVLRDFKNLAVKRLLDLWLQRVKHGFASSYCKYRTRLLAAKISEK